MERAHEFRILVDPTNAVVLRRLSSSPVFPVVAGKPVCLICIVPTQTVVGERIEVFVKGEDAWGNPTPVPGELSLTVEGGADVTIDGTYLTGDSPGTITVVATVPSLSCRSNPLTVLRSKGRFLRFWGDLHGQTATTVGTGTDEEYFAFARDLARLDFTSHQGNDFQVSDEIWRHLGEVIKSFNDPGKFVVLPGYEWSGNTSAGGDHNVIYLEDDQPIFRSSHWQIPEVPEDELTPAHPIDQLFIRLRENGKAILIPHVGGRYANLRRYFDQDLAPVVEIVSCWGVFEWMLWDAFDQGYIVGVVCNSDGHKGRPGGEGPGAGQFGVQGGLTCVLAEELTRQAIFEALKGRRCYGTTGPRIDLWFEADGQPMGACIEASEPVEIQAAVIGTASVEALLLYEGCRVIRTVRPKAFSAMNHSRRIRVSWEGARSRGRARRATWDGAIHLRGSEIERAQTFAFDSPADGITETEAHVVRFKSSTTGDVDGIDLILIQSAKGQLIFESMVGTCEVDLAELDQQSRSFDFGGLGLRVTIERYPEKIEETKLSLKWTVDSKAGKTTPYLVKAIQEDGHMAWASPIYIRRGV